MLTRPSVFTHEVNAENSEVEATKSGSKKDQRLGRQVLTLASGSHKHNTTQYTRQAYGKVTQIGL